MALRRRNKWLRIALALALALGLGAGIGGLSGLASLSAPVTYAIVGALLALFVVLIPPAFGLVRLRISIENGGSVQSEEPAVVADDSDEPVTTTDGGDLEVLVYSLYEDILHAEYPVEVPAGGTVSPSTLGFELRSELVGIGTTGHGNGAAEDTD